MSHTINSVLYIYLQCTGFAIVGTVQPMLLATDGVITLPTSGVIGLLSNGVIILLSHGVITLLIIGALNIGYQRGNNVHH